MSHANRRYEDRFHDALEATETGHRAPNRLWMADGTLLDPGAEEVVNFAGDVVAVSHPPRFEGFVPQMLADMNAGGEVLFWDNDAEYGA